MTDTAIEPPQKHEEHRTSTTRGRLANRTVLVVEDDADSREMVAAVLRLAGANVTAVDSALSGLRSLQQNPPDAIITDIVMPDIDGYAFAREVRRQRKLDKVVLIALTAFPALTAGTNREDFDSFLSKPIEPADLAEGVARMLESGRKV